MNRHALLSAGSLVTAGMFLGYLNQLEAGEVGPMAAYAPPPPVSDCDACNQPGWYGGVSLLYLKPYDGGEGGRSGKEGEWDLGARGTIGFERPDGLFYEVNGFWFDGEYDVPDFQFERYEEDVSAWYVEGLIGDNLHCGEACLDVAFGIRYANLEKEYSYTGKGQFSTSTEFEGVGPVIRLDGTRRLTERVSLYAGVSQAVLFGEVDYSGSNIRAVVDAPLPPGPPLVALRRSSSSDTVAYVTELEGGLLIDLNMGQVQGARLKLGLEGQYWSISSNDVGFIGGVLGVEFNF